MIEQGQEIGRDGRVTVWVERRAGECHVRVGGTACFVREMDVEVTS